MKKLIGKRELSKLNEDRCLLVEEALSRDIITKSEICKATGLKMSVLNNVFTQNRKLYAKYCVIRRTITDVAADNIVEIVMDKTHPKNYDASKEVLKNFRTDLDDVLDSKETEVLIENTGKAKSPVRIVFGNTSSKN